MDQEKLRVAIIGCGEVCRNHVRGYLRSDRYELVALCDVRPEGMVAFDKHFNGSPNYNPIHFVDAETMLSEAVPDVVSIGVWDGLHKGMVDLCANAEVTAIMCEKPMSDSTLDAWEMIKVCEDNAVKLAVGHQRRFLPSYNLVREAIANGHIGDVHLLTSFARDGLPNYSSHLSDTFRYLLGDPECLWVMGNVERFTDQWARAVPIEDKALGIFGFAGGAQAFILSGLTDYHGFGGRIYGSDGTIEFTVSEMKIMSFDSTGWVTHRPDGDFELYGAEDFEMIEAGAAQMTEFARWITGESANFRGEAINGYKSLEMVHAVYESARTYSQVILPMKPDINPLEKMIDSGQLPVLKKGKYDIRARAWDDVPTTPSQD